jgi:hypothetical protein
MYNNVLVVIMQHLFIIFLFSAYLASVIVFVLFGVKYMNTVDKPSPAFISEILKDELDYKERKKDEQEKKRQAVHRKKEIEIAEEEVKVAGIINSELESKPTMEGQWFMTNYDDPLSEILNSPPYYYLIQNIPEILVPKFKHVKKIYFGAKMIKTQHMQSNMVALPIIIHKLFIGLLIEPPQYEDIVASHKASVSESSFAFNLEEECYYRWFNNLPSLKAYHDYMAIINQVGISLHFNYSPQKLIMALENVKEF